MPTTYDFPAVAPNLIDLEIMYNTKEFVSPLSGYVQNASREGTRWIINQRFSNLFGDDRGDLLGFLNRMNGRVNRAKIYIHSYHGARGALGGSPLVDGADQTGSILDIKGMTPNITDIFKAGDLISYLNTNSNWELKMINDNADSDGAGLVSVEIGPEVHTSPADGVAIITTNPAGTFMLKEPRIKWADRPEGNSTNPINSDINVEWLEDIA